MSTSLRNDGVHRGDQTTGLAQRHEIPRGAALQAVAMLPESGVGMLPRAGRNRKPRHRRSGCRGEVLRLGRLEDTAEVTQRRGKWPVVLRGRIGKGSTLQLAGQLGAGGADEQLDRGIADDL